MENEAKTGNIMEEMNISRVREILNHQLTAKNIDELQEEYKKLDLAWEEILRHPIYSVGIHIANDNLKSVILGEDLKFFRNKQKCDDCLSVELRAIASLVPIGLLLSSHSRCPLCGFTLLQ